MGKNNFQPMYRLYYPYLKIRPQSQNLLQVDEINVQDEQNHLCENAIALEVADRKTRI